MTKAVIKSILLISCFLFCVPTFSQSILPGQWQIFIDSIQKAQDISGILIHVEAPKHDISWTSAAGVSDMKSKSKLTGHEPVRIASITKSFVATAILRLWEEGQLTLFDPVTKYISQEHAKLLREGGYIPELITLRHLISHTSGLFDHGSSSQFIAKVLDDPQHQWTRTEQIRSSMSWGRPVGRPGERFSYSDTGYLLLGEVIENVTGKSLGIALRELIDFEKHDMRDTWFEITEEKPTQTAPRAHQYLDTTDTYDFHASLDLYGGGGIVTTMEDLTDFYQALFSHRVFRDQETLDVMLTSTPRSSPDTPKMDYRMGIWLQPYSDFEAWTHSGFWGVQVWYIPDIETAVAIAVTRQGDFGVVERVMERVVGSIIKE